MPSDAQASSIVNRQRAAQAPQEDVSVGTVKRRRWWPLVLLLLVVLAGAGWYMRRSKTAADNGGGSGAPGGGRRGAGMNLAVPVGVAPAAKQDIPVRISALGSVTPFNTVTVRPRVDGQLMRVGFEE